MAKTTKLNQIKFGLAGGITTALCVFIITIIAMIKPEYAAEFHNILKGIYGFLGYDISFLGAILGALYGFIDMFIFTWIFALIYNKLS